MKPYERHILDQGNKSICGEVIGVEFSLHSIDFAFHCIRENDFIQPCSDCLQEVLWTFEDGLYKFDDRKE